MYSLIAAASDMKSNSGAKKEVRRDPCVGPEVYLQKHWNLNVVVSYFYLMD